MSAQNLLQNLIVMFVLLALFILIYCRMTGKTLLDIIKEVRDGFKTEDE